uniref:chitin synthase n=1 Tax=Owenia fusiformis TaxID=6347 RepID=A0A023PPQ7_OWEFU|nr:chitin synthase [Owenia fusiformis]
MCCIQLWKGVVCTLLFVLMLASLVFNKASLIWLLGGTKINNVPLETWYAAFALVFLVPELFAVIKVLWNTSFIKQTSTHQWPSGVALLVGFLVSFAEVSSYLMFTLEIAPRLPIQLLMPLLSSVFAVALCYEQWESYMIKRAKDQEVHFDGNFTLAHKPADTIPDDANWKRLVKTLFGLSGIWATCAIAAVGVLTSIMPWFQALCLPTSLSLLSLAWSPKVQMYIVRSPDGTFQGRWKAMCLYTVFKIIVLMVGISIIMVIRLQQHHILDSNFFVKLGDGLYGCSQKEILYPLLIHFGSSLCGHLTGFAAATLCVPNIGMTLPSVLATPIAIAIGMYFCIPSFQLLDELTCYSSNISIWCMFALASIAWVAPYLILGTNLTKQCAVLLKPMDELFIQSSWNGLFLDQHMFLNYTYEGFTPCKEHVASNKENVSRVFICTTMYREADWEMKRLLTSLYNISQSKKVKDVYLEAHLFLDNGTKDLHLTDFAIQLVSLLESTMSIRPSQANCLQTPYGVQLNWLLPGVTKMPFFIHLKDCSIIKAKKRWSQVMYMSYVLNFRVLRDSSKDKSQVKNKVKDSDDSLFVGYSSDKEWRKNANTLSSRELKRHSLPDVPERATIIETTEEAVGTTEEQSHNVTENRKYLGRLFNTDPDNRNITGIQQGIAITSLLESYSRNDSITNPSSSDQGIGTSQDDVSISSFTTSNPERSVDTLASRGTSALQSDSYWRDYEGDVSSCNENSLTSSKAKQSRSFLTEADMHNELPNINPDESLGKCSILRFNPTKNITLGLNRPPAPPIPQRPLPPKPPRSKKASKDARNSKKKQELKESPSTQQLIDMDDSQTNIYQSIRSTAMESELKAAPRNRKSKAKDDKIFTIARETIPKDSDLNETRPKIPLDDNTYILATDADMEFTDESILDLLHLCNHDRRLGGACGRTHPIGQNTGPVVWYQKFEYAKDFWMIKSSQNVVGSVMCCPGCFSLYRASAIRDIISNYAGPTDESFDVFIKDTGEDRWMCTLMMLNGWKLEYSAFCHNTTYCPDTFMEFMKQRRRWVLSDLANMLLVFKNIFKLARKNDSFSLAYILYLIQMFTIVLFAPASTIVIIAGGFDIIYGIPFQIVAPGIGVMVLLYSLLCIVGSMKVQTRATLLLTSMAGLSMVLVVIGGAVYIAEDIYQNIIDENVGFQEYYLILFLIGALLFAAFLHPCETWILAHGFAYLLGFPAMQIFLPIYAICNIVDQSWGTRENNKPKTKPAMCCGRSREKSHKKLKKKDIDADVSSSTVEVEEEATVICTDANFRLMKDGSPSEYEEYLFWEKMREIVLGTSVNLSVCGKTLKKGLAHLRNICLGSLLVLNSLWLMLLSVLYFNADLNLVKLNVYGLIAGTVYGLVLLVQVVGLISHRFEAVFARYAVKIFGGTIPVWVFRRTA